MVNKLKVFSRGASGISNQVYFSFSISFMKRTKYAGLES